MSDTIHSSDWTGPPAEPLPDWERRLIAPGAITVEEARKAQTRARQRLIALTPETRRLKRAALLLMISPLAMWLSWVFVQMAIPDAMWNGQLTPLLAPALFAISIGALEFRTTSVRRERLRRTFMHLVSLTVVAFALLYAYEVIQGYRHAKAGPPVRSFELTMHRSKGSSYLIHQLQDGSTMEGVGAGPPRAYSQTCAEVQWIQAPNGFGWVRVVHRSPPPGRELLWPIRREDCFSDKPLASLRS